MLREWDSNNEMQQSGGLLLAAGLDGGNTLVAVHSRTATQTNPIIHPIKDTRLDTFSSLVFLFYVGIGPYPEKSSLLTAHSKLQTLFFRRQL